MKRFLSFLLCVFCMITGALQANQKPIIVFDFGGVIAEADTAQMKDFLLTSFQINGEELSNALRNMQKSISEGQLEYEYWEQYAASRRIVLPKDWIEQFGTVIDHSITANTETIAIVKALQNQWYPNSPSFRCDAISS